MLFICYWGATFILLSASVHTYAAFVFRVVSGHTSLCYVCHSATVDFELLYLRYLGIACSLFAFAWPGMSFCIPELINRARPSAFCTDENVLCLFFDFQCLMLPIAPKRHVTLMQASVHIILSRQGIDMCLR